MSTDRAPATPAGSASELVADIFGGVTPVPLTVAALALFRLLRTSHHSTGGGEEAGDDDAAVGLQTVWLLTRRWTLWPRWPVPGPNGETDAWEAAELAHPDGVAIVRARPLSVWDGCVVPTTGHVVVGGKRGTVVAPDGSLSDFGEGGTCRQFVVMLPDGRAVCSDNDDDGTRSLKALNPPDYSGGSDVLASDSDCPAACLLPNGHIFVARRHDRRFVFHTWSGDVATAPEQHPYTVKVREIWGLAALPNGREVVLGAWDRILKLDITNGDVSLLLHEPQGTNANYLRPTVLPDGYVLAVANCHARHPILDPSRAVPVPPNGTGDDGDDVESPTPVAVALLPVGISAVVVLPGGCRCALVESRKNRVRIGATPSVADTTNGRPSEERFGKAARRSDVSYGEGVPYWAAPRDRDPSYGKEGE